MAKKKSARRTKGEPAWAAPRLTGKRIVISGRFPSYLNRKSLQSLIEAEGGLIEKEVAVDTDYLLLGEAKGSGPSIAEKRAEQLNQKKGASIDIIDCDGLGNMIMPDRDQAIDMLRAGAKGTQRFQDLTRIFFLHSQPLTSVQEIDLSNSDLRGIVLASDGNFACCTQNLFPCGGLRGKLCKHLLVLIVGLANAGEVDPTTIEKWVTGSRRRKPALDKDLMSETLLRYKGAEAGEIDWRPTETLPEDFYTF